MVRHGITQDEFNALMEPLLRDNDAQKWAKAFMLVLDQYAPEIDEALMVSWFANAMQRQEMVDEARYKAGQEAYYAYWLNGAGKGVILDNTREEDDVGPSV